MSLINSKRNCLNCILPRNYLIEAVNESILAKDVAIIIHLHYADTFEWYKKYIENIPKDINIFFTTSNEELRNKLTIFIEHRKNSKIIEKNNRGRDISSFLVACRKEILKYKYFCFLHDKKEKNPAMKKDTEQWIYSQWENMLGSENYIKNIITCFNKNPQLGLLLPPIPFTEHYSYAFMNNWKRNFENTVKLAKLLGLQGEINKEISPMAIGTVYWARVDALRKLLQYEWRYEDFDEEPLADDGRLSHAIERVLEYVARDAGYDSKWVMTDCYAEERLQHFNTALSRAFERLEKSLGIHYIYDLDKFDERLYELQQICKKYKKVYIYGAGMLGRNCLRFLNFIDVKIKGFIVTNMESNEQFIDGIPVYTLDEVDFDNESGVIVAVNKKYQKEIFENLKTKLQSLNDIYNWCPF